MPKLLWPVVIMALVILLLGGCSRAASEPTPAAPAAQQKVRPLLLTARQDNVLVYFHTPDGRYAVPLTFPVAAEANKPRVAIERLLAGPPNEWVMGVMPENTKLKDFRLVNTTAYIDLTSEFESISGEEAVRQAVNEITLTLSQFPQINEVQLSVDGMLLTNLAGLPLEEPLSIPESINPLAERPAGSQPLRVYYADDNAMYLVPVTYWVPAGLTPEEQASKQMEYLLQELPADAGLSRTIWPGTRLLGLSLEGDTAVVDLSQEAVAYGGGHTAEDLLVKSLIFTLTEQSGISKVQLLIEGEKHDYLPEGTAIGEPLSRPAALNEVGLP